MRRFTAAAVLAAAAALTSLNAAHTGTATHLADDSTSGVKCCIPR